MHFDDLSFGAAQRGRGLQALAAVSDFSSLRRLRCGGTRVSLSRLPDRSPRDSRVSCRYAFTAPSLFVQSDPRESAEFSAGLVAAESDLRRRTCRSRVCAPFDCPQLACRTPPPGMRECRPTSPTKFDRFGQVAPSPLLDSNFGKLVHVSGPLTMPVRHSAVLHSTHARDGMAMGGTPTRAVYRVVCVGRWRGMERSACSGAVSAESLGRRFHARPSLGPDGMP